MVVLSARIEGAIDTEQGIVGKMKRHSADLRFLSAAVFKEVNIMPLVRSKGVDNSGGTQQKPDLVARHTDFDLIDQLGLDAVTLRDGRQLLVYNHSVRTGNREDGTYKNGRQILNMALSKDGHEWKTVYTLENEGNPAGYSYPAVIQTRDGLIHITYTWKRQSVKHVVLDPALIK